MMQPFNNWMVLINPNGFGCVLVFPETARILDGYICVARGLFYSEANDLRDRIERGTEDINLEEV